MATKNFPCVFNNIIPYENFSKPVTKDELGGHCDKQFFVFLDDKKSYRKLFDSIDFSSTKFPQKKLSQSEYFVEMFTEAKNPDCSYVSPFVDVVKDGYIPSHIYALKKEFDASEFVYNELLGSRLFNYLQIPTVFNIAERIEKKDEFDNELSNQNFLISVDFLKDSQQYASLFDIDDSLQDLDEDSPLSLWIIKVSTILKEFCNGNNIEISSEKLKQLLDDFCEIYLIRNIILDDLDFETRNIGIVYDEFGYLSLAPQHDMEYLFKGGKGAYYMKDCLEKTLSFMQKFCPDRLQSIMENKVAKINNTSNKREIINMANRCVLDDDQRASNLEILFHNFNMAEQVYNNMNLATNPNM